MSVLKESIVVDPISMERVDIAMNIHRYNFGWMKRTTIVGADDIPEDGIMVEQVETTLAGNSTVFAEVSTEEILPPSNTTPEVVTKTDMEQPIKVGTYLKEGRKFRTAVRVRLGGESEIMVTGASPFKVIESKEYADAIGGTTSGSSDFNIDDNETYSADGGIQITVANGVKTITEIQG